MAAETKPQLLLPLLLFFSFLFLSTTLLATADPEVQLCKKQCERQQQFDQWEKLLCKQRCEEYGKLKAKQQEKEGGSRGKEDPEAQLQHCKHECRASQLSEDEQRRCEWRCEEHKREEVEKQEGNSKGSEGQEEKLQQCMHQCQSTETDRRRQHQCRKACDEQYREGREEKGMLRSVF